MFVKTLNILVADWIKVPSDGLTPLLDRKIHERLVFTNPDYEMRHNRGEWIGNIPPQISCLRQKGRTYLLPRGFLTQLIELCKRFQQPYRIVDRRRSFDPLPIEFHGHLKSYQQDAAEAIFDQDFSTIVGGHKSGKTVIALYSIAQRRQPTLVLIPKLDLLEGWLTKIENFLQIPRSEVGIFADGVQQVGRYINISHTGEMMRYWRKIYERVGYLIIDDCHRCPSKVFTHLLPNFDARYTLGLSSTAQRKDRLSKIVYYFIGDVVYTINEKDAREGRGIIPAHVVARSTDFEYPYHSRADYPSMLHALMCNEERTRIIADDIEAELSSESIPLIVLSGGNEQDDILRLELIKRGINAAIYRESSSDVPDQQDQEEPKVQQCPDFEEDEIPAVILISSQTLSRCFHKLKAKALFLAVPTYFGKGLATAIKGLSQNGSGGEGKKIKIYDYVDQRVGLLENYFRMRSYNYGVHPDILLGATQN